MIKRQWCQVTSIMVAIAASAAIGATAHASTTSQSMAGCSGDGNGAFLPVFLDTNTAMGNGGLGQFKVGQNSRTPTIIACPVDNLGTTPSSVTVDVFMQTNVSIGVQACVTFVNGGGGSCGNPNAMQSSGGIKHLQPPLDAWTGHPTDYRWLRINVNNATPPGFNTVFGYRQN